MAPSITLHVLDVSHPSAAAEAALNIKGLEYERVVLRMDGSHPDRMEQLYGAGHRTVPGMIVDGEPVHGSNPIMERAEQLAPDGPSLYPDPIADAVHEAAGWGARVLQPLGRSLPWGALAFRPEMLGTLGGGEPLDAAGTDYAMKFVHASWKYHKITCVRLHEELQALPGYLAHVDELVANGTLGDAEHPNAADLQIGSALAVLEVVHDLDPLFADRPCRSLAQVVPDRPGEIPAGAFPAGWVPSAAA